MMWRSATFLLYPVVHSNSSDIIKIFFDNDLTQGLISPVCVSTCLIIVRFVWRMRNQVCPCDSLQMTTYVKILFKTGSLLTCMLGVLLLERFIRQTSVTSCKQTILTYFSSGVLILVSISGQIPLKVFQFTFQEKILSVPCLTNLYKLKGILILYFKMFQI